MWRSLNKVLYDDLPFCRIDTVPAIHLLCPGNHKTRRTVTDHLCSETDPVYPAGDRRTFLCGRVKQDTLNIKLILIDFFSTIKKFNSISSNIWKYSFITDLNLNSSYKNTFLINSKYLAYCLFKILIMVQICDNILFLMSIKTWIIISLNIISCESLFSIWKISNSKTFFKVI